MIKKITSTLFTKAIVAFINLAVLLLSSKYLGGSIIGQMSLLVLNISIIQIINEVYTGSSLVYFIPKFALKRTWQIGIVWTLICVLLINLIFSIFNVGLSGLFWHSFTLSLIISLHSFNMVIVLAKEKIRIYNFLLLLQVAVMLAVLAINIFIVQSHNLYSYLLAWYSAYAAVFLYSTFCVMKLIKLDITTANLYWWNVVKKGFTNQLGNLAHTLSNRFNYYMIGSASLLGVYANSTSLIESVWIIGGSAAPVVLSHIANSSEDESNGRLVFRIARLSFLLSLLCVFVLYFIPNAWFIYFLGNDFAETKHFMLYLSPGILAISFSTVISHYFSGLGEQRVQLLANLAGLCCTISLSAMLIGRMGLQGACITASLSYFVQSFILFVVFLKRQKLSFKLLFQGRI